MHKQWDLCDRRQQVTLRKTFKFYNLFLVFIVSVHIHFTERLVKLWPTNGNVPIICARITQLVTGSLNPYRNLIFLFSVETEQNVYSVLRKDVSLQVKYK